MKLKVTSSRESFRRGGLTFGKTPSFIDTDEKKLTKAQVSAIQNEPNLNVVELSDAEFKKATGTADKKDAEGK